MHRGDLKSTKCMGICSDEFVESRIVSLVINSVCCHSCLSNRSSCLNLYNGRNQNSGVVGGFAEKGRCL